MQALSVWVEKPEKTALNVIPETKVSSFSLPDVQVGLWRVYFTQSLLLAKKEHISTPLQKFVRHNQNFCLFSRRMMVLETDLFSSTSCHLRKRVCGGKDHLTQCCWNFYRAGMCLSASVRVNLWLTLTPKMRRACPGGEGRSAVTWHSSSRCHDFWAVTHKTHDGVGVVASVRSPWRLWLHRAREGGAPAAARSCYLVPALSQVRDSVAQPKFASSCAYHPKVLVRSCDGLTRGLMPREQETGLSWGSWEGWRTKSW